MSYALCVCLVYIYNIIYIHEHEATQKPISEKGAPKITWESHSYIGQGEKVLEHIQGVDTIRRQRHMTQTDRVI